MEHFSLSGPRFHGARPAAERCVPVAEQWKSVIAVVRRLSGFRSAPVVPEHLRKHDLQHTMNPMISRTWLSAVALAALAPLAVAQNFSYSDQDVLLAIRPTAANSSTSSLLMNLGPVSSFYNAAPGTSFSVGSTALVGNTFSSLVGLSYSFSAANKTVTSDAAHPLQTLWVSRGRVDPTVQSDPWQDKSSGNLANTATKISTLGSGATTLPAVPGSSGNAVLIPNSDTAHNVGRWIGSGTAGGGSGSTYNGTFQGNSEVTKLAPFGAAELVRADFYEVTPGTADAKYLGYFQINNNGGSTFTAAGVAAVPEPGTVVLAVSGLAALVLWRRRSSN